MVTTYLSNPDLNTILTAEKWKGTPLDASGSFVNHEHPFITKFSEVLKWQTSRNPQKEEKSFSGDGCETPRADALWHV